MHKQENSIIQNTLNIPPKVVSKPDPETGYYNPFPNFSYTGPLRPVYPLSPRREIPKTIPHPDYAADGIPKAGRTLVNRNKVEILDKKAQDAMRKVCRLAREVLDIAAAAVRPGISTDEIDRIVHEECIKRNVSATHGTAARAIGRRQRVQRLTVALVLPVAPELQPLPQVCLYLDQRGHLPRHSRPAHSHGRRHCQPGCHTLPRRLPR